MFNKIQICYNKQRGCQYSNLQSTYVVIVSWTFGLSQMSLLLEICWASSSRYRDRFIRVCAQGCLSFENYAQLSMYRWKNIFNIITAWQLLIVTPHISILRLSCGTHDSGNDDIKCGVTPTFTVRLRGVQPRVTSYTETDRLVTHRLDGLQYADRKSSIWPRLTVLDI